MSKKQKNKSDEPKMPKRFTTYKLLRTSLTERQIVEVIIEDGKVVEVKASDPDLGRIVMGKFFSKLWQDEETSNEEREAEQQVGNA